MNMRGVRVLVTGGAGFIGSHIVFSLVNQGANVRVLDNFSSGLRDNLTDVGEDIEVLNGDVRDANVVHRAMHGCRVVSHQAAQLEITKCLEDPLDDLKANTVATINIFDAAAKAGVERVIYASSACVYGQPEYLPSDEAKHPTNPNWPYGVSKLAAEKYAAIYHKLTGIPIAGLHYAIIYGPREWYGRVLTIFLKRLLSGQAPSFLAAAHKNGILLLSTTSSPSTMRCWQATLPAMKYSTSPPASAPRSRTWHG